MMAKTTAKMPKQAVQAMLFDMTDERLIRFIELAQLELNARRAQKRSKNLIGRLKPLAREEFWAGHEAMYHTSDTQDKLFDGGYFIDTRGTLYAKTLKGILYRYSSFHRRWNHAGLVKA